MTMQALFPTLLWQGQMADQALIAALSHSVRMLEADDAAGRRWCRQHRYGGYTSYASLDDLPRRDPAFARAARWLVRESGHFAAAAHLDTGGRALRMDSLWANILRRGQGHSGHIHPHSIISGSLYLDVPDGAGAIRFEDPRLPMMMHAPPRTADAPDHVRPFVTVMPAPGMVLLWESWLRHEVLPGTARQDRLSISFNLA